MNENLKRIIEISELIGKWKEFLNIQHDWTNPYITIAQNKIKKFEKEREEYIEKLQINGKE